MAATGKYSKETLRGYDKFQWGMLIRTGVFLGLLVIVTVPLASFRPDPKGPIAAIGMGLIGLTLLTYIILNFVGVWKIMRLFALDRKRRRQGLPLDQPDAGTAGTTPNGSPTVRH
ncbi:hypothetical protein [Paenarthrobacter sp. NPDC058040]|uniref:hypothetical protein n=1 Tax=unclassified Paenarthrobacter TaxID=2634190 RepID=UPI0036DF06A4